MFSKDSQRGFSLIEIMVGVVIALIATIIMFQVFAISERQKRTTTGASDAQTNGALALYLLEREIRMAGFNLMNDALNDCNPATTYAYYSGDGGTTNIDLSGITQPIRIIDGGTGPDSIRIAMSGAESPENFNPGRASLRSTMPSSSSELNVNSTHGCNEGGMILMVQPCTIGSTAAGSCTLMEITQVQSSSLKIQHNPGSSGPTYNPKVPYQDDHNWPAFKTSTSCAAYGICMSKPSIVGFPQFGISSDFKLTSQQVGNTGSIIPGTSASSLASGIMDLQAEYGITSPGVVSEALTWQKATGAWVGTASLSQTQVKQIKAVRVAIVARSGEYEKPTNAAGTCETTTVAPSYSWGTFNTTNWPADWQCYRYKVFETVIPLVNVIWAKV